MVDTPDVIDRASVAYAIPVAHAHAGAASSLASSSLLGGFVMQEGSSSAARRSPSDRRRRPAFVVGVVLVLWSVWESGLGRRRVANARGWSEFARFWKGAVHPRVDTGFLRLTLGNAWTTLGYALCATALSVILGLFGALLLSDSLWQREFSSSGERRRNRSRLAVRFPFVVPRGIHEAVWGLVLLNVLGRDPLVAVLALAIPYGAITARVFADLIDESAQTTFVALRAAGASRLSALAYGVFPTVARDMTSYGFYRLECALRSAVILGMIGVGGLGFQLNTSFSGLAYGEMWTALYALAAMSFVAERWASALRSATSSVVARVSLTVGSLGVLVSAVALRVRPWNLWSPRSRRLGSGFVRGLWPPRLPFDGWSELTRAARDTAAMSILAIVVATGIAVPLALLTQRGRGGSVVSRLVALMLRTIPPTVWALLVVFLVYPGVLPGAIALGIYTGGVLARLFGEVAENNDRSVRRHLLASGSSSLSASLYGTIPDVAAKWGSLGLYRWEVAARETIVVGVVGAGGLGRLLSAQSNSLNFHAMATTLATTIVITLIVDSLSRIVRSTIR